MTSFASKTMNFESMRQEYEFLIENEKKKIVIAYRLDVI
jgi:hypothetical protein